MIGPYENSAFNLSLILWKGDTLSLCRKGLNGEETEEHVIRNKHPEKEVTFKYMRSCPV